MPYNIEELLALDEFDKVKAWLETNVKVCYGPIENVRFQSMLYLEDLDEGVHLHVQGYNGRGPFARGGELEDEDYAGFYGDIEFDVFSRKDDVYMSPYDLDFFEGLPIFIVNKSPLAGGGREKIEYRAKELVSMEPPVHFIREQTQRFRCKIFMFAMDFDDLAASFRVRQLLTA